MKPTRPFRWTKRNALIREALNAGMDKDELLNLVRANNPNARPSELAMMVGDWSTAIDNVRKHLKDSI